MAKTKQRKDQKQRVAKRNLKKDQTAAQMSNLLNNELEKQTLASEFLGMLAEIVEETKQNPEANDKDI